MRLIFLLNAIVVMAVLLLEERTGVQQAAQTATTASAQLADPKTGTGSARLSSAERKSP